MTVNFENAKNKYNFKLENINGVNTILKSSTFKQYIPTGSKFLQHVEMTYYINNLAKVAVKNWNKLAFIEKIQIKNTIEETTREYQTLLYNNKTWILKYYDQYKYELNFMKNEFSETVQEYKKLKLN